MNSEILKNKILRMLPVNQDDVWRRLGLEHRLVSKVVLSLLAEGFVTRTSVTAGGHRTYLLERSDKQIAPKKTPARTLYYDWSGKIPRPELKEKILAMLPITQDAVWKTLKQNHTYVSRLIRVMVDEGLITRKESLQTFLLELPEAERKKQEAKVEELRLKAVEEQRRREAEELRLKEAEEQRQWEAEELRLKEAEEQRQREAEELRLKEVENQKQERQKTTYVDIRRKLVGKKIPLEELKAKVFEMLPMRQDEVWKTLKQNHTYVSIAIRQMIDEGIIKRTLLRVDGFRKSYILEKAVPKKELVINRFRSLLSGAGFAPCTGCPDECDATMCDKLHVWVTV
jgi:predicted transcriptional regulator